GLALLLVRRIEIGGLRGKLRGARVDALVDGTQAELMPPRPDRAFVDLEEMRDAPVGKAHALQRAEVALRQLRERPLLEVELDVDDLLDLRQEPRVDLRVAVDFLRRHRSRARAAPSAATPGRSGRSPSLRPRISSAW